MPGKAASAAQSSCAVVAGAPGDERDGAREAAVRDRDARVGERGDAGGDAGHDLEGDAGGAQRQRLLAAAAEHERVAALQAHDRLPARARSTISASVCSCGTDVAAALLADEQQLGVGARAVERRVGDQAVVQDHVGARDQLERARRQQAGVAGSGADQVDAPGARRTLAGVPAEALAAA